MRLRLLVCWLLMLLAAPRGWPQQPDWFTQARAYLQQGNWQAAKDLAEKALASDPQQANAEILLGLIAIAQSQFPEAENHFLRATEIQPKNFQAHAYLGSSYFQQHRLAEAEKSFRQVIALNPSNATAHFNLGLIVLEKGQPAEALTHFQLVAAGAPEDVPVRMALLETQLRLKDKAAVKQSAEQLARLMKPDDPRLVQAGGLLASSGEYDAAIAMFEKGHAANPSNYELNFNLVLAYSRAGRLDDAAAAANSLLTIATPGQAAEVQSLLGGIEAARNHPDQALAALSKAAQMQPKNEDFRFDYANFLLQLNRAEEAVQSYQAGVQDFPKSWRMLTGLGGSLYVFGRFDDAASALLQSIQMEPGAPTTLDLLGKSYEAAQSSQGKIREVFERHVSAHPKDALASYHYANILYLEARAHENRDFTKAAALFRRTVELDPDFAPAHLSLGILYQEEKKFAESVQELERATKLAPESSAGHYRLAQVYQQLGESEKAKAEIALFQKLKAGGADARETAEALRHGRAGKQ